MTRDSAPLPVILGMGINGYGILRSLASRGLRPHGLVRAGEDPGSRSRLLGGVTQLPAESFADSTQLATALLGISERLARPLILFPTSDDLVLALTKERALIATFASFHWNPIERLLTAMDKHAMAPVCTNVGIKVPAAVLPGTLAEVREAGETLQFPVIAKPSKGGDAPFPPGQKNSVLFDSKALEALFVSSPSMLGRVLCQELVDGPDSNIWQVNALRKEAGQFLAVSCMRKVRQYPPRRGTTSYGKTEWNEELVRMTRKLLDSLDWNGLASVEYKYGQDQRPRFIELNPRLPWYNWLCSTAGANLAYSSFADLAGIAVDAPASGRLQRDGVSWGNLANDWASLRAQVPAPRVSDWIRWSLSHLTSDCGAWRNWLDPIPGLLAMTTLVHSRLRRRAKVSPY